MNTGVFRCREKSIEDTERHRKTLSVTIHGQIMDKLKETAAKKQMTVSAVTDEMLYRGLVDAGLMEE